MPHSSATSPACSGPAPPKGAEREAGDVVALLDRDGADRAAHVGVGDAQDTQRRRFQGHAERFGDALPYGGVGRREIEAHAAAEQRARFQAPEAEVGVRDRGLHAAAAVRGRSRIGTGGAWADLQRAR